MLRHFGLRPAGGNHRRSGAGSRRWDISTDHFDARRRLPRRERNPLEEILVERSTYSRGHLKQRLYDEGLKERACELCGQGEQWRGRRMALILDHINGVGDDNRLENLQIVCPNCAATLDTHCGAPNRLPRGAHVRPLRRPFRPSTARSGTVRGVRNARPRGPSAARRAAGGAAAV